MSGPIIRFALSSEPLDPAGLAADLSDHAAGAVATFDGRVRDHNDGKPVSRLEYQAYPALALAAGTRILTEEAERHGLLRVIAVHRTGALGIGESAVWLGVAAAHRGPAFDGVRAIMERLKYELPVWKKETYADGTTEWVGPDNTPADGGIAEPEIARWDATLEEIWISAGNDFRGHFGGPRGEHGITSVPQVACVAGLGLKGDRYFGYREDFKGQVTFMAAEAVDEVRERFGVPALSSGEFRRNLIVRGVDLSAWIGRRFRFQGVDFEGSEECKPCQWMEQVAGAGAERFLAGGCRGGLRARILADGILTAEGCEPRPLIR